MTPRIDAAWLAALCDLPGVSGAEGPVRARIWERLRPRAERAWVDAMGSLVLTWNWDGGAGPRIVLAAHMDEVGLIVNGADADGLLRFDPVGGIDPRILPGLSVQVGAAMLPGTVALPPVHLSHAPRDQAPDPDELRIDIGAGDTAEAERAVRPGERAVFASSAATLGRLFRAKALDDRAGVAAIVAALEALPPPDQPLAVAFTVQEEIGTRGAAALAATLGAERVVVVETTTAADLPAVPSARRVTRLGAGPALTVQDGGLIAGRALTGELAAAAARAGVPFQWKEAAAGGTDGARFQAAGAEVAVVSLPCRYLHTPSSVMDPRDLEAEAQLLWTWLSREPRKGIEGS